MRLHHGSTYFKIQDDKPKSYSNRRMMKKTYLSQGKSTWKCLYVFLWQKTTVTANLVTEGDPLIELKMMNNLLGRRKKWRLNRGDHSSLGLIIPRGQSVSGHVVQLVPSRSSRIRHRSKLTGRDWKNAVQGLGKIVLMILPWNYSLSPLTWRKSVPCKRSPSQPSQF